MLLVMKITLLNKDVPYASNCYLIESQGEYALIDPSSNPEKENLGKINLKYIILTHTHFDHMLYIDEWQRKYGAEVIVSVDDAVGLTDSVRNCYKLFCGMDKIYEGKYLALTDGDSLMLGGERLEFILAPGHTAGSMIVKIKNCIFVGDTLFSRNSYGRTDLPSGDYNEIRKSIMKILSFPDDYILYSGHAESISLANIKYK